MKREERENEYLDEEEKQAFDAENKKALQVRQKRRGYTKGEFEGSDEEKEDGALFDTSDAYSKPSRGGGKPQQRGGRGGKKKINFSNEDFPTL